MQTIRNLSKGDLIAIVAPAGKVLPEQILPAIAWLRQRGYKIWQGNHLLGNSYQYSGNDEERFADLQNAMDNPEVKAILFARGGYGTIRLIERLNFSTFQKQPKWLAGFSDITILHNICSNLKLPSVHGAMLRDAVDISGNLSESFLSIIRVLEGYNPHYEFAGHPLNREGSETALLTGGNLSLLYSLLGTPYDIDTKDCILFIEDIGEYLYHTDRMMISLRLAGKLRHLKGLVVGHFTEVKDNTEAFGKSVEEIIMEAVSGYTYPVCFGFQSGHHPINNPLVFGKRWRLKVENNVSLLNVV
jgi:muramoyltetrapeptide carboxypeptidase